MTRIHLIKEVMEDFEFLFRGQLMGNAFNLYIIPLLRVDTRVWNLLLSPSNGIGFDSFSQHSSELRMLRVTVSSAFTLPFLERFIAKSFLHVVFSILRRLFGAGPKGEQIFECISGQLLTFEFFFIF